MAKANAARSSQPESEAAQPVSVCKALYEMEPCDNMWLYVYRTWPTEDSFGQPCSGGLPEVPYDGGIPDEVIRREYQQGKYRTRIVIQEPGKKPTFASKFHEVEIPEGEPIVPPERRRPARAAARAGVVGTQPSELDKLREQVERLAAHVAQPQPQRSPKRDKLRRLLRTERAEKRAQVDQLKQQLERIERERAEEKRQQRDREERAQERAALATLFQQGAQAITTQLGEQLSEQLEETKGSLLEEVDERIGKLAGGGAPTDRFAMAFQAGERIVDKLAEAKKEERSAERSAATDALEQQVKELEAQRAQLLTQLGHTQTEKERLAEELKKKRGHEA